MTQLETILANFDNLQIWEIFSQAFAIFLNRYSLPPLRALEVLRGFVDLIFQFCDWFLGKHQRLLHHIKLRWRNTEARCGLMNTLVYLQTSSSAHSRCKSGETDRTLGVFSGSVSTFARWRFFRKHHWNQSPQPSRREIVRCIQPN